MIHTIYVRRCGGCGGCYGKRKPPIVETCVVRAGNILLQIDANSLNDGWHELGGFWALGSGSCWGMVKAAQRRAEACGMLNALECFRMVDRITRSNSIRNTLCCCFYYLCLWDSRLYDSFRFVSARLVSFLLLTFARLVSVAFASCCRKWHLWCGWRGAGGYCCFIKNGVQSYTQFPFRYACVCVRLSVRFLCLFIFMMFPFWHFIEEVYRRHCCCCINK